jgi:transcriptional regulator of NAD metabolism
MSDIETPFTSLKQQIDELKKGVDKCFIPSIYVHTYKIASIVKDIQSTKLTESQKSVMNKLDEQTFKQFERLSTGRCSCTVKKDI